MADVEEHDPQNVAVPDVRCIAETDRALLVVVDGEEMWMPQGQVHEDSEVYEKGGEGTLIISKWIAGRKGLWED